MSPQGVPFPNLRGCFQFIWFSWVFIGASPFVTGFRVNFRFKEAIPLPIEDDPKALESLLFPLLSNQPKMFQDAHAILKSLERSPSCNRRAASALLRSCRSFLPDTEAEQNDVNHDFSALDDFKSLFAASLALCEIGVAKTDMPTQCLHLSGHENIFNSEQKMPPAAERQNFWRGNRIAMKELNSCLRALQSRPQWWTSYSNARQNAAVLCHASRTEIERDQLLELYRSVAKTSTDINDAMLDSLKGFRAYFQNMHKFAVSVEKFNAQLTHDLQKSQREVQKSSKTLMESFGTSIGQIQQSFEEMKYQFLLSLNDVRKDSAALKAESDQIHRSVAKVFSNTVKGSSELAAQQTRAWEETRALAAGTNRAIESILDVGGKSLSVALTSIRNQLAESSILLASLNQRQAALDKRLVWVAGAMENLSSQALVLQQAQTIQSESQHTMHESLRSDLRIAHGLVHAVTESAANLKATIDEAADKADTFGSLQNGLFQGLSQYLWAGLVVAGLCILRNRLAGYAAVVIGTTQLLCTQTTVAYLDYLKSLTPIGPETRTTSSYPIVLTCFVVIILVSSVKLFFGFRASRERTSVLNQIRPAEDLPSNRSEKENGGDSLHHREDMTSG